MAAADDIKTKVRAEADGLTPSEGKFPGARAALGTPDTTVEWEGDEYPCGTAWGESPFEALVRGIGAWSDDAGDVSAIKAKLNELIGEFNQLLDDHNNGVIPSTASSVTPLT